MSQEAVDFSKIADESMEMNGEAAKAELVSIRLLEIAEKYYLKEGMYRFTHNNKTMGFATRWHGQTASVTLNVEMDDPITVCKATRHYDLVDCDGVPIRGEKLLIMVGLIDFMESFYDQRTQRLDQPKH